MSDYNRLAPVEQNHPTLTDSSGIVIAYVARLERERDALREALREMVSVLADYVNDEDPTLLRARAALEAKP